MHLPARRLPAATTKMSTTLLRGHRLPVPAMAGTTMVLRQDPRHLRVMADTITTVRRLAHLLLKRTMLLLPGRHPREGTTALPLVLPAGETTGMARRPLTPTQTAPTVASIARPTTLLPLVSMSMAIL